MTAYAQIIATTIQISDDKHNKEHKHFLQLDKNP